LSRLARIAFIACAACAPDRAALTPSSRADSPRDARVTTAHCQDGMALIAAPGATPYCIDRWEASLVEVTDGGVEQPFPFFQMPKGKRVRAVSREGVVPQGYASQLDASAACAAAAKRLCTEAEWVRACKGPKGTTFPYGNERRAGACNDHGTNAMLRMPPSLRAMTMINMNHPALLQMTGTVAPSGAHVECTNEYGVNDMMGNLHEWIADGIPDAQESRAPHAAAFAGGFFLDTQINGDGCDYKTTAHADWYHDYSTGFRCCSQAMP
jgi:sulfatase modifying factor 1